MVRSALQRAARQVPGRRATARSLGPEPHSQQSSILGVDEAAKWAVVTFLAAELLALVVYIEIAHSQWFFYDEWDFLADRSATSANDLLRPHLGHLCTLPILVYRLLWSIVGL